MTEVSDIHLGVVIPAFGHPKFLSEAIISACEQEIDHSVWVVVVDDGCRFQETADTVHALMVQYPGKLFYVRQENTRLPGARNTGIRFLLGIKPDIAAIFFLDADNRLSPTSLQAFWGTLEANPYKGWAYPDINFFGLVNNEEGYETRETARHYSKLKHLVSNISEAGSMVRADVFHAGVFFDETMTSGFEDWEFWLSALDAGFQGVHTPHAGFMYRVRAESMLSESQRVVDGLVQKIRTKHSSLFAPTNIMRWEQEEAPAFAIYVPDEDSVMLISDFSAEGERISLVDFKKRFHDWAYNYHEYFFPTHLMILPRAVLHALQSQPAFLRWFLWQMRECDNTKQCVQLKGADTVEFKFLPFGHEDLDSIADVFCVHTSLLWERAHDHDAHRRIERSPYWATLSLPFAESDMYSAQVASAGVDLEAVFEGLASDLLPVPQFATHASKMFSGPHAQTVREILIPEICAVEGREPFSAATDPNRTLFVIEAVALNDPRVLGCVLSNLSAISEEGNEVILLLENMQDWAFNAPLLDRLSRSVTDIVPLNVPKNDLGHTMYLGGQFEKKLSKHNFDDATIVARACKQIVSLGVTTAIEIFGDAKRYGCKGYVSLLPEFVRGSDAEVNKLLAYEHAIAQVLGATTAMGNQLIAGGFPAEKLTDDDHRTSRGAA